MALCVSTGAVVRHREIFENTGGPNEIRFMIGILIFQGVSLEEACKAVYRKFNLSREMINRII